MNVPDGKGSVSGPRAQPRLHRSGHVFSWPGHASGTRLPGAAWLRVVLRHRLSRSCVTPTTTRTRITSSGCRTRWTRINAVKAVKSSKLPYLDKNRVGWLRRSMGGGVTLDTRWWPSRVWSTRPLSTPPSVPWPPTIGNSSIGHPKTDRRTNRRIARTYGLPDEIPEFWRGGLGAAVLWIA